MKSCISIFLVCISALSVSGQTIKLTGSIFDPGGAVVVNGNIKVIDQKGRATSANSNSEGEFLLNLLPGIYALEVGATGFLTVRHKEFLIVNSTTGRMSFDFILFGAKYHEPCGYSGANCLPAKSLIRDYEVKYSPTLTEIWKEFTDFPKSSKEPK
jgi:hypothetical protein